MVQKLNGVFENDHRRFAILFARGFWMKFTKRQHAKSSALSKNRGIPFRHVAKFVQEK